VGYAAQFYHLIAHDPLNRRGFLSYVDNQRLRWFFVPRIALQSEAELKTMLRGMR
jgi:hypothetical protein